MFLRRAFISHLNTELIKRSIQSRPMHLRNALNRIEIPANMEVKLSEVEDDICTLLDECTQHMKREKGLDTSCRIAGGWVRDKVNKGSPFQFVLTFLLFNLTNMLL